MRSDAELSKGCEEEGSKKGTKAHKECMDMAKMLDKMGEQELLRKQEEEANERARRDSKRQQILINNLYEAVK